MRNYIHCQCSYEQEAKKNNKKNIVKRIVNISKRGGVVVVIYSVFGLSRQVSETLFNGSLTCRKAEK